MQSPHDWRTNTIEMPIQSKDAYKVLVTEKASSKQTNCIQNLGATCFDAKSWGAWSCALPKLFAVSLAEEPWGAGRYWNSINGRALSKLQGRLLAALFGRLSGWERGEECGFG